MSIVAIICEYNPFTKGHLHQMELAKTETGCSMVACVMSGSFTQRGDAAIADKYCRAELAIRYGADIVVELPLLYAISPADNFAYGALKTISVLPNVEYISFGSECGDAKLLEKAADILIDEPIEFKAYLRSSLDEGNSFPKSRATALNTYCGEREELSDLVGILDFPNNVLGIAYIQQIKAMGLSIKIHTVKRLGADYNDNDINSPYPSASAVRKAIAQGKITDIKEQLPPLSYSQIQMCNRQGTSLGDLCLFRLKGIDAYELSKYYDISGGIHNRIKLAAETTNSYEDFLEAAKTKKYTMARIKRIALYSLFDITREFYREVQDLPPYLFILALNKEIKETFLSEASTSCENLLLRYSDINKVDKSLRPMIKLDFRAQGTLEIINRSNYYRKSVIII